VSSTSGARSTSGGSRDGAGAPRQGQRRERAGNGELEELRVEYRAAEDDYVEAERLHEEKRGPYERRCAPRAATRRTAPITCRVEEIREQLQKAPQEYEALQDILEKYKQTCQEHELVVAAGGLHILGRAARGAPDRQPAARPRRPAGRPGSSRFYLSLEDDLLRIFGADRMQNLMDGSAWRGVPIEHRLITRAIRNAQEKVEAHNFDIRKHLLEYDDVPTSSASDLHAPARPSLARRAEGRRARAGRGIART